MKSSDIQAERQQQATRIITRLQSCADIVFEKFPVDMAYIHGSIPRGRPLPSSDIDIAVVLSKVPPAYERLKLELLIQASLEDQCQLANIDVRSINTAPLLVQGQIIQEGMLLYCRDKSVRIAFEVLTRKKYFDYLPTAERMQQAILNTIRKKGLFYGLCQNDQVDSQ
jgi:predicted nucleotidyltransferase